tara:strand:+ start:344 stop:565 length:222 start_codon:yes stop_codon:yes gene_type:complete
VVVEVEQPLTVVYQEDQVVVLTLQELEEQELVVKVILEEVQLPMLVEIPVAVVAELALQVVQEQVVHQEVVQE